MVFLLGFYFGGATGVPRRYDTQPLPGPLFAQFATIGAIVMLLGFTLAFFEGLRLRSGFSADRMLWPEDLREDVSLPEDLKVKIS